MDFFDWRTPSPVVLQWLVELSSSQAEARFSLSCFRSIFVSRFCLPRIPHVMLLYLGIIPVCIRRMYDNVSSSSMPPFHRDHYVISMHVQLLNVRVGQCVDEDAEDLADYSDRRAAQRG